MEALTGIFMQSFISVHGKKTINGLKENKTKKRRMGTNFSSRQIKSNIWSRKKNCLKCPIFFLSRQFPPPPSKSVCSFRSFLAKSNLALLFLSITNALHLNAIS